MQRLIRTSCAIAAEDLGKEKAEKIAEAAQRRYEELLNENAGDSKALRKHTFRRIYPAIAAYETFKSEGIEPDKAVWYMIMPSLFHEEYDLLPNVRSLALQLYTNADDAGSHCNMGNMKLALDTMIRWIDQMNEKNGGNAN